MPTRPALEAFGPTIDPRGAHVLYHGRMWDVIGRKAPESSTLTLRTFNGETTIEAPLADCTVLLTAQSLVVLRDG